MSDSSGGETVEEYKARLVASLNERYEQHRALAVEYLQKGKTEMAHSSRTLSSCYAKVRDFVETGEEF